MPAIEVRRVHDDEEEVAACPGVGAPGGRGDPGDDEQRPHRGRVPEPGAVALRTRERHAEETPRHAHRGQRDDPVAVAVLDPRQEQHPERRRLRRSGTGRRPARRPARAPPALYAVPAPTAVSSLEIFPRGALSAGQEGLSTRGRTSRPRTSCPGTRRVEGHVRADLVDAGELADELLDLLGDLRADRAAGRGEGERDVDGAALDLDLVDEAELDEVEPELGIDDLVRASGLPPRSALIMLAAALA